MIETLPTRAVATDLTVSTDALAGFTAFQASLVGRSQIVWGEHCSECAYPKCYEACAFYTPRPDLHCRRFEAGIEPLATPGAGRLHRIRFRQWGKLEGRGAKAIATIARVQSCEQRDQSLANALIAAPAPYAIKRLVAARWNARKQDQARQAAPALAAEAFVVEAWAADGRDHAFTLTLLNTEDGAGQMFQTRFEARPNYQRLVVPIRDIAAQINLDAPFLVQIEPIGEAAGRDVVFGVCDFVVLAQGALESPMAPAADARPVKVVVWDLDETLWSGTLAEDGPAGVRLRPEAARAVKALDDRGVLQSIASKNNEKEALAALRQFGLADYFLHPQIHWNPKSESVARIARLLDLNLDSFVFIDDQPFERGEVIDRHPAVRVLRHTDVADLAERPWFDLPVTAESGRRRALYQAEAARAQAFELDGADDYLRFLRQSDIHADLRRLEPADAERVYELSQRTNQLNFRGAKYGRDDVQAMLTHNPDRLCATVRCADRFGDYGLIGFLVADLQRGEITDFFMSCRVQRKRVEHALFAWIAREAAARGHSVLGVQFQASARNTAARVMLEDLGFGPNAEETLWTRDAARPFDDAAVVQIRASLRAEAA